MTSRERKQCGGCAVSGSEAIEHRLAAARRELETLPTFDYMVVNADGALDAAVDAIAAIIDAEHHRVQPRRVTL